MKKGVFVLCIGIVLNPLIGCKAKLGCFQGNCMTGRGIYYYENGDRYEGEFLEGKRNHEGNLFREDGTVFMGEWKNNIFIGGIVRELRFKDGRNCTGEYRNSNLNGEAMCVFSDGTVYKGQWLNGQRSGNGILADPKKKSIIYSGEWENDKHR